ncbi:MAG: lipase [Baekduia sp.]|nr:lipase [Baekduia sp.]
MDPAFDDAYEVPVDGGWLTVARAGPPVEQAGAVVLALHGITASHLAWASVARELADTSVCLLAPDLRGRGRSAHLPGPYGLAAHVADMRAVLDDAGVELAVVAGHSMGAYVAAGLAAEQPGRVSALVLVDGGLPLARSGRHDPEDILSAGLGSSLARLGITFAKKDDYLQMWRFHPAFAGPWDADLEAYLAYDLVDAHDDERPEAVRCTTSAAAVRTDGMELLLAERTRETLSAVQAPVSLLLAAHGLLDDDNHLMDQALIDEFVAARPDADVETVSDVNHYTILLGPGPGPARVTNALRAALGLLSEQGPT